MDTQVTIPLPLPPDFFEALAQRVAEILNEQPPAQRFMDTKTAATYLGVSRKSLSTKDWRDEHGIPYGYIGGKLAFDRLALDERFASCSGNPAGSYSVARAAQGLLGGMPR